MWVILFYCPYFLEKEILLKKNTLKKIQGFFVEEKISQ